MAGFQIDTHDKRRSAAADAKRAMLEQFRARASQDDPEIQRKIEERKAIAAARAERDAIKAAAKAAEQARLKLEAEQKAREAAQREAEEAALARQAIRDRSAMLADQKAKRDARYAARKARTGRR